MKVEKKRMKRTVSPLVVRKRSRIHGLGLFASSDIPRGTRVIEYAGEKITKAESDRRYQRALEKSRNGNGKKGTVYIFTLNKRQDLDGDVYWNTARYINHSCDPNCDTENIGGHIWIAANRHIKKGEEISYNYGYDVESWYEHPCRCGSRRCIGYILSEEHWPKLKRKLMQMETARRLAGKPGKPTTSPYITIRKSKIHGTGVFAGRDIPADTVIIEYVGAKITKKESDRRYQVAWEKAENSNGEKGTVYIFTLDDRYDIDGDVSWNTAGFINHSCEPNCETDIIDGHIYIISIRPILRGEELSYNYGYDFESWQDHPCRCGAPNCVGYILDESHWPRLRRKLKQLKSRGRRRVTLKK
jgi:SET domain-containing protein